MKVKYPKSVRIAINWAGLPFVVHGKKSKPAKPYHLHPGNEVKLKRENEWMRRWLRDLLTGKAGHFEMMAVIKPRMPDLFAGGKKGK